MAVVAVIFLGGLFVALIAATFEVTFQPPQAWERIGRKRINWLMMLWFGWVLPVVGIPALFAYAFGPRRQVRAVLRADPGVRREPMSMRQVVAHVVEVTGPQGPFRPPLNTARREHQGVPVPRVALGTGAQGAAPRPGLGPHGAALLRRPTR